MVDVAEGVAEGGAEEEGGFDGFALTVRMARNCGTGQDETRWVTRCDGIVKVTARAVNVLSQWRRISVGHRATRQVP